MHEANLIFIVKSWKMYELLTLDQVSASSSMPKREDKLISLIAFVWDSILTKRFHVNNLTQMRSIILIYRKQLIYNANQLNGFYIMGTLVTFL